MENSLERIEHRHSRRRVNAAGTTEAASRAASRELRNVGLRLLVLQRGMQ